MTILTDNAREMIRGYDLNNDGKLDFEEFHEMMLAKKEEKDLPINYGWPPLAVRELPEPAYNNEAYDDFDDELLSRRQSNRMTPLPRT